MTRFNMGYMSGNRISEELIDSFNEEMTQKLANRLEEDNYNISFDLAINRPELTAEYIHLLDQETFDEN